LSTDERIAQSRLFYEQAIFTGDASALAAAGRVLDAVEADLALARGRVIHGRFLARRETDPGQARPDPDELALFDRALRLYQAQGDVRGEAESLFWAGCFHQVVSGDDEAALPLLDRSLELAAQAGDKATMAEARSGDHPPGRAGTRAAVRPRAAVTSAARGGVPRRGPGRPPPPG
jgi:hypothetical protein